MEAGQRGYLLTGNSAYMQPYSDAKGRIEMDLVHFWLSRNFLTTGWE
jgi:CHASE3 domain-containing protein